MVARSRFVAPAALAAVLLLVAAVVLFTRGGDDRRGASTETRAAKRAPVTPSTRAKAKARTPVAATLDLGPNPLRGDAARHAAVPILMYHVIAAPRPGTPLAQLWVAPERFSAQMAALADAGYRAVTLGRVFAAWNRGTALPHRPMVVSFDDGYLSHARSAAPVLRSHRWPGVLNLELHNLGPDGLPVHLLKRMVRDGWEVDSHTLTHPDLTTVDAARLRTELVDSRAEIQRRFGQPANFFCYPAGAFDDRVVAAVRAAGYAGATTELPGLARSGDRMTLHRIRVNGDDSPAALLSRIAGA